MAFDSHANFASSNIIGWSGGSTTTATQIVITSGTQSQFPATPFNCAVYGVNQFPTVSNAEIVRVTGIISNTFTVIRQAEGSVARSLMAGDIMALVLTTKTMQDVEGTVTAQNWGGVTPTTANYKGPGSNSLTGGNTYPWPSSSCAITVDTSNGMTWWYYLGQWH